MADEAAVPDGGPRAALARRWPTLLALLVSAPGFADQPNPAEVHALAEAMLLLPLWYVVVGAVARRGWTWFVLVGVIGLYVLVRLQDRVESGRGRLVRARPLGHRALPGG